MADFKNPLISRILGVSSSLFFHRATLLFLWNRFSHVLGFLVLTQIDPLAKTIGFALALTFASNGPYSRSSHFSNICFFFFRAVFCTEQLWCSSGIVFRMFLAFLVFDPNWPFWKGYSLCMGHSLFFKWVIFKILSFLEYLVFFRAVFFPEQL